MVEGTPLLREHAVMSCIEGSNPSVSANPLKPQNSESNQRLTVLGLFSFSYLFFLPAGDLWAGGL